MFNLFKNVVISVKKSKSKIHDSSFYLFHSSMFLFSIENINEIFFKSCSSITSDFCKIHNVTIFRFNFVQKLLKPTMRQTILSNKKHWRSFNTRCFSPRKNYTTQHLSTINNTVKDNGNSIPYPFSKILFLILY